MASSSGETEEGKDTHVEIREGSASMFYNKNEAVFYNKIQVFNRDMSIQVIRLFESTIQAERNAKYEKQVARYQASLARSADATTALAPLPVPREPIRGITILDALAASGLRSVRYLKEIPNCRHVTINDLDEAAVRAAEQNCITNGVDASRFTIHHGDASLFMYLHREPQMQFDVIDLDPYGTACPFLDSAVQAVSDGGLLCVTCTDMPTLSGNYPEVCFAKYGTMPLKARYTHEMSLRILLHSIDAAANRYKRHIVPWVSLSVDFYVRVFVRVFENPSEVKKSSLKRCFIYQSTQCPSYYVQAGGKVSDATYGAAHLTAPSSCPETGGAMKVGGPFWGDVIHNQGIVDELLRRIQSVPDATVDTGPDMPFAMSTSPRALGVLTCISEELKDVPMYYILPDIAATMRVSTPTNLQFKSALLNAGYRVSQFHHEPTAIKTDAPPQVIWDIMRAFCALHPPLGSGHKQPSKVAAKILSNPALTTISFDTHHSLSKAKPTKHEKDTASSTTLTEGEPLHASGTKSAAVPGPTKRRIVRFPENPEENWGPKRRAGRLLAKGKSGSEASDDGDNNDSHGQVEACSSAAAEHS